jgi:hypothetical protein
MKKIILTSLFILVFLVAASGARPVYAASAVVGSGTSGSCTEAAFNTALAAANSGGGTITFNCGTAVKTIIFTSSKSILTNNVTINGNDRIVLSGGNTTGLFLVNGGLTFRLQHIILSNGNSGLSAGAIESIGAKVVLETVQMLNNHATNQGGAVHCNVGTGGTLTVSQSLFQNNSATAGGAIFNDGCVASISNSTFISNQASSGSGGLGGAINNAAPAMLTVTNSRFQSNSALDGGGVYNAAGSTATLNAVTFQSNTGGYGGGFENSGTITVNDGLFDSNIVAGSGGGIWNLSGTVTLNRVTVSKNSAYEGGGINTYGTHLEITNANIINNVTTGTNGGGIYDGGGTAFITNATISGNHAVGATANGGGIYHNSDENLTLTNVTLVSNQADFFGGGLYHLGRYAVLTNVTIGNNSAAVAGNAIYEDSPMTPVSPGMVQLMNSVIFGSANNCDGGIFDSLGHNISKGTCTALSQPTDQNNFSGNLHLSALSFNGGAFPMQTITPLVGSPLIDAGGACSATDQRGGIRPVGAACDIGAVEYGAAVYRLFLPSILR